MASLKEVLAAKVPAIQAEIRDLIKNHGSEVVSEVTLKQVYGGMRGVKGLVCDTSMVDPIDGLIIRGIPLAELTDRFAEEIFYLLCTGEMPAADEVEALKGEFQQRAEIPAFVEDVLRALPKTAHPMAMFITAITAMEDISYFRKRYDEGMTRDEMWDAALEDSLQLLAKLPALAAAVYRIKYDKGDLIAHSVGIGDLFIDILIVGIGVKYRTGMSINHIYMSNAILFFIFTGQFMDLDLAFEVIVNMLHGDQSGLSTFIHDLAIDIHDGFLILDQFIFAHFREIVGCFLINDRIILIGFRRKIDFGFYNM